MRSMQRPLVKRLAQLRRARGLTQLELALLVGVVPGTVFLWESGRAGPNREHLARLAEAFCVTPGYLWGMRETKPKPDEGVPYLRRVA